MVAVSTRVLVLDDEELILTVVHDMLAAIGYESDVALRGEDAILMYHKAMEAGTPYCAVLVDLTLCEGMDGLEAADRIRKMDPGAKLVVSSGFSEIPAMAHYEKYGFVAAIPKPYQLMQLKDIVDKLCAG